MHAEIFLKFFHSELNKNEKTLKRTLLKLRNYKYMKANCKYTCRPSYFPRTNNVGISELLKSYLEK